MTKQNPATVGETIFARTFLSSIGAKLSNPYLITAVVAWMRSNGPVLGNNPFGLMSATAPYYGGRPHRWVAKPYRLTYSSLSKAAVASADYLRLHAKLGSIALLIAALRRGNDGTPAGQQVQALDVLTALTQSGLVSHAGMKGSDVSTSTVYAIWASITGLPTIPGPTPPPVAPVKAVVPPKPPVPDAPPPDLFNRYVHAWDVRGFYNARHKPIPLMSGDR